MRQPAKSQLTELPGPIDSDQSPEKSAPEEVVSWRRAWESDTAEVAREVDLAADPASLDPQDQSRAQKLVQRHWGQDECLQLLRSGTKLLREAREHDLLPLDCLPRLAPTAAAIRFCLSTGRLGTGCRTPAIEWLELIDQLAARFATPWEAESFENRVRLLGSYLEQRIS